jgi:hypothetical protein
MDGDVCPAREGDDGRRDLANEAIGARPSATAIEAQSTFTTHGVDSRDLAVAGDEDGYVVEKRPG